MEPWKPILLIIPAGLLLGTLAGQATRPVPVVKQERPWPPSVREKARAIEPWRPIEEAGPRDLSLAGHSYRPDFDYDVYVWPDQTDYAAELLADDLDYSARRAALEAHYAPFPEREAPQPGEAEAELAPAQAQPPVAATAETPITPASVPAEIGEVIVLPPVPPPLVRTGPGEMPDPAMPAH